MPLNNEQVPENILKLWFWMIDDSGSVELAKSATESILKFYCDINMARQVMTTYYN